jgi:prepilin-type N-terminal cleavage/methylation domain-containing protein
VKAAARRGRTLRDPAFARAGLRLNTQSVSVLPARVRAGRTRGARRTQRAFTLVELLTVVVITGILATLAFGSFRRHLSGARATEALNMVQSIRAAEERWRAEHMMYLNVSESAAWFPRDPRGTTPNSQQAFFYPPGSGAHADNDNWLLLRPTAPGAVKFGYMVNAGTPSTSMTAPAAGPGVTWPDPPADNWYMIQAIGDADWDGDISFYRASSLDNEVFSHNHGE